MPIPIKLFHKIEIEGALPYLFSEASYPDRDQTQKENCNLIPLINLDAKVLNKILANRIKEHIKAIIHCDKFDFIVEMQGWFDI